MYDNGDLAVLIAQFLSTESLLVFKTKADMVAAVNLADQVTVLCDGELTYNDGNSKLYYVREVLNTDTIDGIHKVALTNYPTLLAEWLEPDYTPVFDGIKVQMLGYVEDNYQPDHVEPLQLYLSNTTGDDSNDGLNSGFPKKTLDSCLDYIDKGYRSLDIDILDNGQTYTTDRSYFTGLTWHMSAPTSQSARIEFNNGCRLYDCHTNFARLEIVSMTSTPPYQDSNYCYYQDCSFPGGYTSNGGILNMSGCSLPQIQITRTNFQLGNLTITGTTSSSGKSNGLILIQAGSVGYFNSVTVSDVSETAITAILNARYGAVVFCGSLSIDAALKSDFTYGILAGVGSIVSVNSTNKALWTDGLTLKKNAPTLVLSTAQEL